ncbi:hypothetical protein D3C84_921240 [compost metagenome]
MAMAATILPIDSNSAVPEGVSPWADNNGIIATSGMAAMSWNSSTAKLLRPTAVAVRLRSLMACMAMAVEDRLRVRPTSSAAVQFRPRAVQNKPMAAPQASICRAPPPNTILRRAQSRLGSSSRPMMNSISTTPNSPNSRMAFTSVISFSPHGPMMHPASR